MKNRMFLFVCFAMLTVVVSSCKKSTPSVVGNWAMTGLTGTSTSITITSAGNDTATTSYSFAGGSVTITSNGTSYHDNAVNTFLNYTLGLNIQSGGVVNITEKGVTTGNTAFNDTYTGNWYYLSNNTSNDGIQLDIPVGGGYGDPLLYSQFGATGTFAISSVSSSQLQLTYTEQNTQLVGNNTNSVLTLTFSK